MLPQTISLTHISCKIFPDVFITCFQSYFAVRVKTERRFQHRAITFSLKENKENQRELFNFMVLKWTRRTTEKAEVTRSTNELSLWAQCKSLPSSIKVKNTCSSKFVASSVLGHRYSHDPLSL